MPPPGLEGRGSYVWVPHQVADVEHAPVEDEVNVSKFLDDVAEERDDRMTGTDEEEEYVDPHAADYTDFPEGVDLDESHVSADEEEQVV